MNICITGATGFIGKELLGTLLKEDHIVKILSRNHKTSFPEGVEVIRGDLTKKSCPVEALVRDCEVIFHCAGEINNTQLMRALHVEGTKRLLLAAKNESISKNRNIHWVQLSSCGAYGPPSRAQKERTVTENTPTNPCGVYEITKTISDELLIGACNGNKLSFSILRPSNVVGPNMKSASFFKLVNLIKKRRFFYVGKPGAIMTYVHVSDVVNALKLLSTHPKARGQVYNLSYDCTIESFVKIIATIFDVKAPSKRIPVTLVQGPIKLLNQLVGKFFSLPRMDYLALRTRYPTDKIEKELQFTFSMPLPEKVEDIIH